MADVELILCDVGGVLGTNGWDHGERAVVVARFGLDRDAFEQRHEDAVDTWETGSMTLNEYLDFTVFNEPRAFTRDEFTRLMVDQSLPYRDTIAIMRAVAATRRYRMMTMNNESAELHENRARLFGLEPIFSAYLTSCYVGARKPEATFYDRATAIAHAHPDTAVFIDDRPENLAPMRDRGYRVIHAQGAESVRDGLRALGIAGV